MKILILHLPIVCLFALPTTTTTATQEATMAQETPHAIPHEAQQYYCNEKAIATLGNFAKSGDPVFVPQVGLVSLEAPPKGSSDWISWFLHNGKTIIDLATWSQQNGAPNFMLLPDLALVDKKVPDAFGQRKRKIDLLTEDAFRMALNVPGGSIRIPYNTNIHRLFLADEVSGIRQDFQILGDALGGNRQLHGHDFCISQPGSSFYGWHFNHDDTIMYLVEGKHHVRVAGTEVGSPTVIDVVLQPGDALYVPATYYHYSIGAGDEQQSVLWSIGFQNQNKKRPNTLNYADLVQKETTDFALLQKESWDVQVARREREDKKGGCRIQGSSPSRKVWLIICGISGKTPMEDAATAATLLNRPMLVRHT
jgi:uncharacterized RmlC-like cupin family protein